MNSAIDNRFRRCCHDDDHDNVDVKSNAKKREKKKKSRMNEPTIIIDKRAPTKSETSLNDGTSKYTPNTTRCRE